VSARTPAPRRNRRASDAGPNARLAIGSALPLPLSRSERAEQRAREHWARIAPMGRHRYAASRCAAITAGSVIVLAATHLLPLSWLARSPAGDAAGWMLVLGIPCAAALYRVLLARWDQDAERYGGGLVTLDRWRDAQPTDPSGEPDLS
jgi:hypothetical protein